MTPYFFRGSVLITEKVVSYSEFMSMSVFDFERVESVFVFRHNAGNRAKKRTDNAKVKADLSNLPAIDVSKLGFTDEQIEGLKNGK